MRILWGRVFTFLLALVIGGVLIVYAGPICRFLASMRHIGPGYSTEDKTLGLIAFGIVLVGILALARILTQSNQR